MAKPTTVNLLHEKKQRGEKFAVLTAYDATLARLCELAEVDVILVGDSLGMVVQGHETTVPVTMDDIVYHAKAVHRGAPGTLKMLDMPFMSFAYSTQAIDNAARLMQDGFAEVIKLESGSHQAELLTELSRNGVPVCAHLGLTPQTIHKIGSYAKRGTNQAEAEQIFSDALRLEQAGADLILLECVPAELAKKITNSVGVPVIGIGAGRDVDAQVLVIYDILGISKHVPKFAHNFLQAGDSVQSAIRAYVKAVKDGSFPQQ